MYAGEIGGWGSQGGYSSKYATSNEPLSYQQRAPKLLATSPYATRNEALSYSQRGLKLLQGRYQQRALNLATRPDATRNEPLSYQQRALKLLATSP